MSCRNHDTQIKGNPAGYYVPYCNSLDHSKGTLPAHDHYNVQNDRINRNLRLLEDVIYKADMGSGRIVWKAGPYYCEGDDKKLGRLIGPHYTHMIPKGLSG